MTEYRMLRGTGGEHIREGFLEEATPFQVNSKPGV